ncbi:MAG: kelch repeat-containing protein, partial [Ignavibacteriaceae bacterium]
IGTPLLQYACYNLKNAEIYSTVTDEWTEATPMHLGRKEHTATLLKDGRVLVTGGVTINLKTDECEIYDPSNNTWTVTAPMLEKRYDHAAILLNDGNVFVSGGNPLYPWLKSCEVYNVSSNEWTPAADMLAYRTGHRIYYLSKIDKLLILGGDAQPITTEDTWEIYDPVSLEPLYEESFPVNQFLFNNNVQLLNGNILVAGEEEYTLPPGGIPLSWASNKSWVFDITTDVDKEEISNIEDFHLEQNYPNPFNPSTTIRYTLPSFASVKLVVYNTLGKEIAVLVNKKQSSGNYTVNFDAKDLSSGIYFYSLITETTVITKSMILLK